ncbi:MAG: hypothetical protein ACREQL_03425, partial [Candidatus Binatia bacterium]
GQITPNGGTLTNLGTISVGNTPGRIRVEGDFVQESTGRLVMEAGGLAPGEFDVLEISGDATLGGRLDVVFENGFLPKKGQVIPFFPVAGDVHGTFAQVEVSGAAPGFDFELGLVDGVLALTAKNDALPLTCTAPGDADGDEAADCIDNCVAVANGDQANGDADPLGDACDPCTGGVVVGKPVLTATATKLAFKGKLSFARAPELDPTRTGARLVVVDGDGRTLLDVTAPPGAFDKRTKSGWRGSTFRGKGAVRTLILSRSKKRPQEVAFSLKGRTQALAPGGIVQPLGATLVLDAPVATTGLCGEVRFIGPASVNPVCVVKGARLSCGQRRRRVSE